MACILLSHNILEDFNNWLSTFVLSAWLLLSKRCQFWALALMCDTIHISLFKYCLVSALKQLKTLNAQLRLIVCSCWVCTPVVLELCAEMIYCSVACLDGELPQYSVNQNRATSMSRAFLELPVASGRCTKLTLVLLEKAERCTHDGFCGWGFKNGCKLVIKLEL